MRISDMLFFILWGLFSASLARAEYGLGYNADNFDPKTHEYHPIYQDWEEGVVLDPKSGDYTITYKADDGIYSQTTFEPGNKIVPRLKSEWRSADQMFITYSYRIRNDRQSQQSIDSIMMLISGITTGPEAPPDWDGTAIPTLTTPLLRLSWNYMAPVHLGGLQPGRDIQGFRLQSRDLPGLVGAQIKGAARTLVWLGEMPQGAVRKRVDQLLGSDFVPRYAVAPTIQVPTPFAIVPILANLQKHVDKDLVSMNLIEPALVARLDPLFGSAIASAQNGNYAALRSNLHTLRHALNNERRQEEWSESAEQRGEIEDAGEKPVVARNQPIAKIARDVLEFDLKYLEQRIRPAGDRREAER